MDRELDKLEQAHKDVILAEKNYERAFKTGSPEEQMNCVEYLAFTRAKLDRARRHDEIANGNIYPGYV